MVIFSSNQQAVLHNSNDKNTVCWKPRDDTIVKVLDWTFRGGLEGNVKSK